MLLLQICLVCRRRGHSLKNCPNKNDDTVDSNLCYNCGESGHSLAKCPQPLQDGNIFSSLLEHIICLVSLGFQDNFIDFLVG